MAIKSVFDSQTKERKETKEHFFKDFCLFERVRGIEAEGEVDSLLSRELRPRPQDPDITT